MSSRLLTTACSFTPLLVTAPPPLRSYRIKPYCEPFPKGERVCCNAPIEVTAGAYRCHQGWLVCLVVTLWA
jgi:hypothetical protein